MPEKDGLPERGFGKLVPVGGGDPIPLLKKTLLMGRRESCDIVLRFKNVSAHHCQLTVRGGYWYVKDLKSLNGVKVNDVSVTDKRLDSGDIIVISKQRYRILYVPSDLGAVGPPPPDEPVDDIFDEPLLKRAGLEKNRARRRQPRERRVEVDAENVPLPPDSPTDERGEGQGGGRDRDEGDPSP